MIKYYTAAACKLQAFYKFCSYDISLVIMLRILYFIELNEGYVTIHYYTDEFLTLTRQLYQVS